MRYCPRCDQTLPLSMFGPSVKRCRPCDAAYARKRRADAPKRRAFSPVLAAEFSIFMAACAVGGGDANVPPMVRAVSIETINHTAAMQ